MADYGNTVGSAIGGVGSAIGGIAGSIGESVGGLVGGAVTAAAGVTPIVLVAGAVLLVFAIAFLRRAIR